MEIFILLLLFVILHTANSQNEGIPLRYLSMNVGNAVIAYGCWEDKLCDPQVATNLRDFIQTYQPDIVLTAETFAQDQLKTNFAGGPLLPINYEGMCGLSIDRNTQKVVAYNATGSSHEHECISWNTKRVSYVNGTAMSVYGRNDEYGQSTCNYDFTAFKASFIIDNKYQISFIIVHPDSMHENCRTFEINEYWEELTTDPNTVIAGDWNCGLACYLGICTSTADQLQVKPNFKVNYSLGRHWNLYNDTDWEPTAVYLNGAIEEWLDHSFSNFGDPCTDCGQYYGTTSLIHGSAVGGYGEIPRADGGSGCDHRQVLVDMWLSDENTFVLQN